MTHFFFAKPSRVTCNSHLKQRRFTACRSDYTAFERFTMKLSLPAVEESSSLNLFHRQRVRVSLSASFANGSAANTLSAFAQMRIMPQPNWKQCTSPFGRSSWLPRCFSATACWGNCCVNILAGARQRARPINPLSNKSLRKEQQCHLCHLHCSTT